ncbi:Cof-type HAD-IIB family hydrolase [Convivina intestini]|uniref:Uncharacterized protein n=1 Tax=Convivina intestini TaxID=1505726 RepID=A0A2U1D9F9_9LACO|nr:Cof-type HAD-IIB family hydrolase [Convivina intestini]PVY84313.1 hypothetical protein C7384_10458 [Convivina intestini]CAH1855497.1 Putative phosphatase [Convivina intestini]SDB94210.1 hypothetical protein SAMN05216341_10657 [Leuconostocaceae bacterium R-53105]
MADIKIVAIDIDGTLLNDQREITPAVAQAVDDAVAQGVKVVITTGRPISGVKDILKSLKLDQASQFVITHNGGLMATADGQQIIHRNTLTLDDFKEVNDFMVQEGAYLQVEAMDQAYTTNHLIDYWASYENDLVHLPLHVHDHADELAGIDFIKLIAMAEADKLNDLQAKVPADIQDKMEVVRSTAHNLEFMNQTASKGNALLALAKYLNVDPQETMAIGDQENDLSMIKAAGIGVAMGNAIDPVKKIAQVQGLDNNHDGVAHAIQEYVLAK